MVDRMAHRGPDAAGRLAHTDDRAVGPARPPPAVDHRPERRRPTSRSSKHGLTLIYNGELYNYQELRAELIARGVAFTTKSDTEVVLEAWRRWGPDALPRFRGHVRLRAASTRLPAT